ncbi:hypothetical protein CAPTEDRAFT_191165 [Capitella teleta]|uniref:ABC transmembrane type-1 domain-containing protein n=1 Tax=Capitella teleta TaxID=283909 RepID=R7U9T5_CAPTE|nr:hypothetical protein CAPTEDRAFT_191165 [Capitella teleta]|eukprot:ELU02886.1 hypothetical protein CAPTEDRAFT_191165 [Capitella teleta]
MVNFCASFHQFCVDDSLPFLLNILLAQTFGLLGTVVICCYGLPWILILLIPLAFVYYYIQKYYRHTSRDLKRIASVSLSPVYAHFAETVNGVGTIRALRQTQRFEEENRAHLDANQRAQFAGCAVAQWLGLRLQLMGVAMVTGVAFIAVLQHHFHTANPGLIGLAISYALAVTGQLSGVVTMFTETEKQMVSVERAEHYSHHVPHERQWHTLSPPPFWPIQGSVSFQRVCLQFRPGLPPALQNVTFETKPVEKIGIVGRTGSGKSSLFQALFRLTEIESGSICVDGINVGHLHLTELRSRLAIIPQDPFLFSGSIRDNLDPKHLLSSSEVWAAVEKCHMKATIERLGGLSAVLSEGGRPLSVGQRQLLCLARAMLSSAKVICIDEATACVDLHTDQLLQATIRTEFAQHTVLTIAHRIRSILNSDRVLVMNEGRAVEFESPNNLLQNPRSLFYALVHGQESR